MVCKAYEIVAKTKLKDYLPKMGCTNNDEKSQRKIVIFCKAYAAFYADFA